MFCVREEVCTCVLTWSYARHQKYPVLNNLKFRGNICWLCEMCDQQVSEVVSMSFFFVLARR